MPCDTRTAQDHSRSSNHRQASVVCRRVRKTGKKVCATTREALRPWTLWQTGAWCDMRIAHTHAACARVGTHHPDEHQARQQLPSACERQPRVDDDFSQVVRARHQLKQAPCTHTAGRKHAEPVRSEKERAEPTTQRQRLENNPRPFPQTHLRVSRSLTWRRAPLLPWTGLTGHCALQTAGRCRPGTRTRPAGGTRPPLAQQEASKTAVRAALLSVSVTHQSGRLTEAAPHGCPPHHELRSAQLCRQGAQLPNGLLCGTDGQQA